MKKLIVILVAGFVLALGSNAWAQFATPPDSSTVAGWKFTTFTDVDDSLKAGYQIYQKIDTTTAVINHASNADTGVVAFNPLFLSGGFWRDELDILVRTWSGTAYLIVDNNYSAGQDIDLWLSSDGEAGRDGGDVQRYTWAMPESTILTAGTATTLISNYVYVTYNTGSPLLKRHATQDQINFTGQFLDSMAFVADVGLGAVSGSSAQIRFFNTDQPSLYKNPLRTTLHGQHVGYHSGITPTALSHTFSHTRGFVHSGTYNDLVPATSTDDVFLYVPVYNDSAYARWDSVDNFIEYSDGTTINVAHYFWVVIWGAISKDTTEYKLYMNIQDATNTYLTLPQAEQDNFRMIPTSIPDEFHETGFLIAGMVIRKSSDEIQTLGDGSTYLDLRGQVPGTSGGAGAPATDSAQVAGWNFTTFTDTDDSLTDGHQIYERIDSTTAVIDSAVGAERAAIAGSADTTTAEFLHRSGGTMNGTVNFGGNPIEFIRMIDFDDTITAPAHSEGRVFYHKIDNTLSVYNNETDITLNVGQEGWVYARNITGSTILDGKVVYITGAVSSRPTVALAQADAAATCKLLGVATHDIETATNGYVTIWGVVHGIDLSDFSDGDEVFLSAAVAGSLTTVAPSAPNCVVEVGYVIDGSANGDLFVLSGKSKSLNMLQDVLISGPASGNVLVYDGTVWADSESVPLADSTTAEFLHKEGGTMTGNITMPDDGWIGGGASKGRMVYKDETQDTIMFWNAFIRSQSIYAVGIVSASVGLLSGNGLTVSSGTVTLTSTTVNLPSNAVDASAEIANQIIVGNHIDSVGEDFVFDGAYHKTSGEGDSALVSRKEMRSRDQVKAFVIQGPDSDHDIKLWKTPVAITIDSVFGQCDGGTNVIGALDEYDWDNTDLVAIVNADWTFTTTYQAIGSFTNAGIAAKNHLKWHTTSVSGSVDFFDLTIWFHED